MGRYRDNTLLACLLLLILAICSSVGGKTIIVDDDPGPWADYQSIHDAINSSVADDTILVLNGTYSGNVVINRSIAVVGNGSDETFAYRDSPEEPKHEWIFLVVADNVTISGFGISSDSQSGVSGIQIKDRSYDVSVNYTTVRNCSFRELEFGVRSTEHGVSSTQVTGCSFLEIETGIYLDHHRSRSYDINPNNSADINDCRFKDVENGIHLENSHFLITNCTFFGSKTGIRIWGTSYSHYLSVVDNGSFQGDMEHHVGCGIGGLRKNLMITNCNFTGLEVAVSGGYSSGWDVQGNDIIERCFFFNNLDFDFVMSSSIFFDNHEDAYAFNSSFFGQAPEIEGHILRYWDPVGNYYSNYSHEGSVLLSDLDKPMGPMIEHATKSSHGSDQRTLYKYYRMYPHGNVWSQRNDLWIESVTTSIDGPSLANKPMIIYLEIGGLGTKALDVPVMAYRDVGKGWVNVESEADLIKVIDPGTLNGTMTIALEVQMPKSGNVSVFLNAFSKAVKTDGSLYWEANYTNNWIVLEIDVVKPKHSGSGFGADPSSIMFSIALICMLISVRKRRI